MQNLQDKMLINRNSIICHCTNKKLIDIHVALRENDKNVRIEVADCTEQELIEENVTITQAEKKIGAL